MYAASIKAHLHQAKNSLLSGPCSFGEGSRRLSEAFLSQRILQRNIKTLYFMYLQSPHLERSVRVYMYTVQCSTSSHEYVRLIDYLKGHYLARFADFCSVIYHPKYLPTASKPAGRHQVLFGDSGTAC